MTFIEMFPPMSNRIKVQVYDQDALSDDCIATHFIELSQIMDPGGETEGRPDCEICLANGMVT